MSKNTILSFIKAKKIYFLAGLVLLGVLLIIFGSGGEKKEENEKHEKNVKMAKLCVDSVPAVQHAALRDGG